MGLKGRKRRLKNFEKRATAFVKDLNNDKGYKLIDRDDRITAIGVGKHKRLVKKKSALEAADAIHYSRKLVSYLNKKKIVSKSYQLVIARLDSKTGVQEYFNRPSFELLVNFKWGRVCEKENADLCRKLFGDFPGITWEKLREAETELLKHLKKIDHWPDVSNIIVVGQTRDGKLRLALVDI